jgi:electron transport complex protein RnfA
MDYFIIIIAATFVNNFVLSQFLGICSFIGVSKKIDTALGMGFAVIFVMAIASVFTYAVNKYILVPLNLEYLMTISFILVIAGLVQIVEMVIKKFSPGLYSALGVYLPLITTNCAVLGVAIMNITNTAIDNLFKAFLNGVFSGLGYTIAILMLAGIRVRMRNSEIPEPFKGFPITLVASAIMSMAFVAFNGLV